MRTEHGGAAERAALVLGVAVRIIVAELPGLMVDQVAQGQDQAFMRDLPGSHLRRGRRQQRQALGLAPPPARPLLLPRPPPPPLGLSLLARRAPFPLPGLARRGLATGLPCVASVRRVTGRPHRSAGGAVVVGQVGRTGVCGGQGKQEAPQPRPALPHAGDLGLLRGRENVDGSVVRVRLAPPWRRALCAPCNDARQIRQAKLGDLKEKLAAMAVGRQVLRHVRRIPHPQRDLSHPRRRTHGAASLLCPRDIRCIGAARAPIAAGAAEAVLAGREHAGHHTAGAVAQGRKPRAHHAGELLHRALVGGPARRQRREGNGRLLLRRRVRTIAADAAQAPGTAGRVAVDGVRAGEDGALVGQVDGGKGRVAAAKARHAPEAIVHALQAREVLAVVARLGEVVKHLLVGRVERAILAPQHLAHLPRAPEPLQAPLLPRPALAHGPLAGAAALDDTRSRVARAVCGRHGGFGGLGVGPRSLHARGEGHQGA